jgi:hypothetical protein
MLGVGGVIALSRLLHASHAEASNHATYSNADHVSQGLLSGLHRPAVGLDYSPFSFVTLAFAR